MIEFFDGIGTIVAYPTGPVSWIVMAGPLI